MSLRVIKRSVDCIEKSFTQIVLDTNLNFIKIEIYSN